jgi:hypothetical protein
MPDGFAGSQAADRFAVHHHIGHDIDLGQAFDEPAARFLHRRPVEIAEAAAEADQVLVAQRLAAHQDHLMLVPGALERGKLRLVERFQVDAPQLGAKRGAGRNDVDRIAAGVACNFAFNTHSLRLPASSVISNDLA